MNNKLKNIFLIKEKTNENIGNIYDISNEVYNIAIKELQQVTNLEITKNTKIDYLVVSELSLVDLLCHI